MRSPSGLWTLPRRYPFTALAVLVAAALALLKHVAHPAFFEVVSRWFGGAGAWEAGSVVATAALLVLGAGMDAQRRSLRRRYERDLERSRLSMLRATMVTVNDVVLDFLDDLSLFRRQAEDGALDEERLAAFDRLVAETATKLRRIGSVESARSQRVSGDRASQAPQGDATEATASAQAAGPR